jgi:hypothetical protein
VMDLKCQVAFEAVLGWATTMGSGLRHIPL